MSTLKFSIITPTYNREVLLQRTIQSILAQTFTNWELIIIDDGSTDNTEEAVKKFLTDKRIKYIKKKIRAGPIPVIQELFMLPENLLLSWIVMTKHFRSGWKL